MKLVLVVFGIDNGQIFLVVRKGNKAYIAAFASLKFSVIWQSDHIRRFTINVQMNKIQHSNSSDYSLQVGLNRNMKCSEFIV